MNTVPEPWHLPHMQNQPNDAGMNMAVWPDGDYLGADESGEMYAVRPWRALGAWAKKNALLLLVVWPFMAVLLGSLAAVYWPA